MNIFSRLVGMSTVVGTLLASHVSVAQSQTITAVMYAGLRSLDPEITTSYIVRDYGYMVYDTLLAVDANNKIQPQMLEKWTSSDDGKTYVFVLRNGLKWHDGTPVTAEDCVASINRWSSLDKMGQIMHSLMTNIEVVDAKTFKMTFKVKTDLPIRALGKPSGVAAFMMPKRVALTPPGEQINETIGSGPFRFVATEYKPGVQAVFDKNKDYVPRPEAASGMAGGKVVKVDRVTWVSMPDSMTAVNALESGEIDFIEMAPHDLLPMMESNPDIVTTTYKQQGMQDVARLNFTQPPFNNKMIRQAALLAIDQKDVLQAQVGNAKYFNTCSAVLSCTSPLRSDPEDDKVVKGHPDMAAALLKQAKYDGTPVVILQPTDVALLASMPPVYAQALRKAGFNVQIQAMDWQTVGVRRTSREPTSKGGWSIFSTANTLVEVSDPLGSVTLAGNGKDAWYGWPDVPAIEQVRDKMSVSTDPAEIKSLAAEIQRIAIDEVMIIPLGEYYNVTAKRKSISNQIDTSVPVFWNMTKGRK